MSLPDICVVNKTPTNEVSTFVNLFHFNFNFTLKNHVLDKGHSFITPRFGWYFFSTWHFSACAWTCDTSQKEGYDASFPEKKRDKISPNSKLQQFCKFHEKIQIEQLIFSMHQKHRPKNIVIIIRSYFFDLFAISMGFFFFAIFKNPFE